MPRYYFIIQMVSGDELQADAGEDLPSDDAAQSVAEQTAYELSKNTHRHDRDRLLVKDERGYVVYDTPLGDVWPRRSRGGGRVVSRGTLCWI
jgi:hypothetical protein